MDNKEILNKLATAVVDGDEGQAIQAVETAKRLMLRKG